MFGHIVSWVWLCWFDFSVPVHWGLSRGQVALVCVPVPVMCHEKVMDRPSDQWKFMAQWLFFQVTAQLLSQRSNSANTTSRYGNVLKQAKTDLQNLNSAWFDLICSVLLEVNTSLLNRSRAKKPKSLQRSLSLRLHLESSHQEGNRAFYLVMRERERQRAMWKCRR